MNAGKTTSTPRGKVKNRSQKVNFCTHKKARKTKKIRCRADGQNFYIKMFCELCLIFTKILKLKQTYLQKYQCVV